MVTAAELHPDGDYAAGRNNLFVAVFSDQTFYGLGGSRHAWTGVLKRIHGNVGGSGLSIGILPPPGPSNIITDGGFNSLGPGTDIGFSGFQNTPIPPWSYKFIIKFAIPTTGGEYVGRFEFDFGNTTDIAFYWVRAPSTTAGQGSATDDFPEWYNLDVVSVQYGVPFDFNHGVMAIDAPHVFAIRQVKTKSRIVVQRDVSAAAGVLIRIFNSFVRVDSRIVVGRTVRIRAGSNVRVGNRVTLRASVRVAIHHVIRQASDCLVQVINARVSAETFILVGSSIAFRYDCRIIVYRPQAVAAQSNIIVGYINVENLKNDMQIIFGVDTELVTKTLVTIPAVNGAAFSQNLEHVLIETGSETVRRLNFPGALSSWSAAGLYEIDYVLGRFRWIGANPEPVELTYRHSSTRITDQNIISSIIKASSFIQERLKPAAAIGDPRFRRGAEELAMSFLLDAAIWNMTQTISAGAAAGTGSRRIDLMQNQKREFERRAYETLGPFIHEPVPGTPVRAALARPKSIRVYGE